MSLLLIALVLAVATEAAVIIYIARLVRKSKETDNG